MRYSMTFLYLFFICSKMAEKTEFDFRIGEAFHSSCILDELCRGSTWYFNRWCEMVIGRHTLYPVLLSLSLTSLPSLSRIPLPLPSPRRH